MANCRHNWYPFFEGVSEKNWTKEMLEDIDSEPFEFEDKKYTFYEATQKQRQIERTIRKYKHRVMMYDKVGDDESKLIAQEDYEGKDSYIKTLIRLANFALLV